MNRYIVGGAQNEVTWYFSIARMIFSAVNFSWSYTNTVAPASH